ncbi:hypothetical protein F53441_10594 [Fusarium austroafricanum]|uniref:Reverse transcriptase domain-containing protein n=1 Tax=Fusarium austroafricanum TaxID=2364996 RepID=A0A8H4KA35_9HYPO|nr:hypothetical protein F53441_10594 [Fusarium austroafricanum]
MDTTNQDNTMIEDLEYMNIEEEYSDFDNDHIGGGDIGHYETLLKHVIIWNVNLKGAPMRIRHLENALRLAPKDARPLILAIEDPPNRLAFRDIPGYNIFYSSDHPITEEQYPTWGNGASVNGTQAATNTANGADLLHGPPVAADEPLMHRVCFYVHKSIPTTSWRAMIDPGVNKGLVATLELLTANGILTIHNIYNRNNTLELPALFGRVDESHGDVILLGDFNLHHRTWSGHSRNETAKSRLLNEYISSGNMKLLTTPGTVTFPNSQDETTRSSTIDLAFANNEIVPDVMYYRVHPATGFLSDHRIIETRINRIIETRINRNIESRIRTRPCLDNVNQRRFMNELVRHLPPKDHPLSTRQEIVSYFSKLIQALRETIRLIAPRIQKDKRELWRIFTEAEAPSMRKTFHLASLGAKICRPLESCQLPTMNHEGESANTDEDKINMFKKVIFRANNGPKSCKAPVQANFNNCREELQIRQDLTDGELEELIKGLPRWKSTGPDQIPYEAIQLGGGPLRIHLLRVFQVCLSTSYHPDNFKDTILIMVRKPGRSADLPTSWRPLALLSCLGKVLEKIVASRMQDALKAHPELLPARQFGWRTTSEALQFMLDKIYSAWAMGKQALLQTLADKGFPSWIVEMIRSFLSDRTASFHLPGIVSEPFDINTGVPQGSPLSPILFLFFAAPLLERAKTYTKHIVEVDGKKAKVDLFAFAFVDDIYLMAISDSYAANCKGLEMLHESVMVTARELDLRFGAEKYKVMHFKKQQSKKGHNDITPDIHGFTKKPEDRMKILGVIVSCDLTWGLHISELIQKVRQRMGYLGFISGATWGPNLKKMRLFFITKIRPVFTYACGAWFIRKEGGDSRISYQINNKQMKRLEDVYTFCLRKISGAFYRTAAQVLEKEMFIENIWTVLYSQATLQRAKSYFAVDQRWRPQKTVDFCKSGVRNPYDDLNLDALTCINNLYESILNQDASGREAGMKAMGDPKGRHRRLRNYIKIRATRSSWVRWEDYILQRRVNRAITSDADNSLKLPAALMETWGSKSLGYYKNDMSRAQTTILLHCRTEVIGLKAHLSKIGVKEARSGRCACKKFRETPFHLFVQCDRLNSARKKLADEVDARFGGISYEDLLTKHSQVATQWALKYFDIEQFDSVRSKHNQFELIPGIISLRRGQLEDEESEPTHSGGPSQRSSTRDRNMRNRGRHHPYAPRNPRHNSAGQRKWRR